MTVDVEPQGPEHQDNPDMAPPPPPHSGTPSPQPPLPPPSPPLQPPDSASALPPDAASKRQRRPNVRLNEIGSESCLANVVEYLLKRKGHHGVVGAKRGRPPKLASPDGDGDGEHHAEDIKPDSRKPYEKQKLAEDIKPDSRKPYEKQKLTPKVKNRKGGGLGKNHNTGTGITKHAKRPKVMFPHGEGNGNNWMQKTADGFLEAADGCVYACSDTDKHVRSPSPHAQPAMFSFESDSPKGLKKTQVTTKRKKKAVTGLKLPSAAECAHKNGAIEEKEDPSSSALQELRMQGPVWERGVAPLDERVREWMQKIGLEKYAPIFQHHEVGDDVLPLLTMDDLKEMGIQAVGARRKFFSEITKRKQSLMLANESLAGEK
ncbi:hypothetical protein GOP47_0022431 [Adiantum capillus-veneris]|uniref:SAM domain-containing protein n=1 Tax=Adiantum capillus-veneris TaxID=13818 RepID=A0A9D4U5R5_ADICA|nr:hypothetical protein GOP47_0022431 [Adiantum capillus-veneris]